MDASLEALLQQIARDTQNAGRASQPGPSLNALMQMLAPGGSGLPLDSRALASLEELTGGPAGANHTGPPELGRDHSGADHSSPQGNASGNALHPVNGHLAAAAHGSDGEDQMEATEDMTNASKSRIREKNRQAQRRFRERQRTLVKELRVQVDLLCRAMREKQADIDRLQHENRLMKALLMKYSAGNEAC